MQRIPMQTTRRDGCSGRARVALPDQRPPIGRRCVRGRCGQSPEPMLIFASQVCPRQSRPARSLPVQTWLQSPCRRAARHPCFVPPRAQPGAPAPHGHARGGRVGTAIIRPMHDVVFARQRGRRSTVRRAAVVVRRLLCFGGRPRPFGRVFVCLSVCLFVCLFVFDASTPKG